MTISVSRLCIQKWGRLNRLRVRGQRVNNVKGFWVGIQGSRAVVQDFIELGLEVEVERFRSRIRCGKS